MSGVNSIRLWRYEPENEGKDWKIHRDELKQEFIRFLNENMDSVRPEKLKSLEKHLAEWDTVENEIELLRLIGRIGRFCVKAKKRSLTETLKKILKCV